MTARTWASFIYLAMCDGINMVRDTELDWELAFVINEANALLLAARIACEEAEIELPELLAFARDFYDKTATSSRRTFFEKERVKWSKSKP